MNAAFVHLDLSQAAQYAVDATLLSSLIETFATSLSKERLAIQTLLPGEDGEAIRMNLHSLKGFVPIFTEPMLAQEVIELEALGRKESLETLRPRMVKLLEKLMLLEQDVKLWRERYDRDPHDPSLFPST